MAKGYIPVNRDQQFLFPPDMRDWLGKDHFVFWLLDVVSRLDTKELHQLRRRGAQGRSGYDPDMLLALLLYAYTHKARSSREIERLCHTDVAFRVICAGGSAPDHTTIARFRQAHAPLCQKLFAQVLELCALAGLAQVGVVALDGTKVAANASREANRSRAQLEAQRARLEAEVDEMFAQAQAADDDEDERFGPKRGDELPEGLASATGRKEALDRAMAALAEREGRHPSARHPERWAARAERYGQELAAARARWAARQATGPRLPEGKEVARLEAVVAHHRARAAHYGQKLAAARGRWAARQATKDRRGMKPRLPEGKEVARLEAALARNRARAARYEEELAAARGRWAARQATGPGLPEGKEVARWQAALARNRAKAKAAEQAPNKAQVNLTDPDSRLMTTRAGWAQAYNAQAMVNYIGIFLAADVFCDPNDMGLFGPMVEVLSRAEPLIGAVGVVLADAGYCSATNLAAPGPTRLIATQKARLARADKTTTTGPAPAGLSPRAAMEHALRTPEGRRLYKQRSWTVEPSFGNLKQNLGFQRFSRRGKEAARAEWHFVTAAANLLKLFRYYPAAARLA
jgi:transposase